ncbi:MAG TPA: PilN domain-containing protein [Candidatus Saccharimonadales bacterium]|nr:PilN domain-containing protein [Candidatus Saccharimonadales bacterium]
MINLLPPETKRQARAARMNVTLYRYCTLVVTTALLLGVVFTVGFWATANDKELADRIKAENQTAAQEYAKTKTAAEEFAKNLATAKTILGSDVSFSDLIFSIAAVIPQGVVLNNLTLGSTTPTTTNTNAPIDISGRAMSYDRAVNLKNSLENSPIFENVNIANISQTDTSTGSATTITQKYPFSVTLKAQFTKKPGAKQ